MHVASFPCLTGTSSRTPRKGGKTSCFNLGNGKGFSVEQVLKAVEKVTGIEVPAEEVGRRLGDPALLVADSRRAREVLGWKPKYPDLDTIVGHAWKWERKGRRVP